MTTLKGKGSYKCSKAKNLESGWELTPLWAIIFESIYYAFYIVQLVFVSFFLG